MQHATLFQLFGAGAFGVLIGWYLYFINRHRKSEVQLTDLVTVVGAVGGAAVLKLFPANTDLFAAYGIGLLVGFFAYFLVLAVLVGRSENFDRDYFIDGRRKQPGPDQVLPRGPDPGAMDDRPPIRT